MNSEAVPVSRPPTVPLRGHAIRGFIPSMKVLSLAALLVTFALGCGADTPTPQYPYPEPTPFEDSEFAELVEDDSDYTDEGEEEEEWDDGLDGVDLSMDEGASSGGDAPSE